MKRILVGSFSALALLTACSSAPETAAPIPSSSGSTLSSTVGSASASAATKGVGQGTSSAASVGAGEKASAVFDGISCDKLAKWMAPLTDGLYLSADSSKTSSEVTCRWSAKPHAEQSGSALDVGAKVTYVMSRDAAHMKGLSNYYKDRISDPPIEALGGYGFDQDPSFLAVIPYFDVQVGVSCNWDYKCHPKLPANAGTRQVAVERIAKVLANA